MLRPLKLLSCLCLLTASTLAMATDYWIDVRTTEEFNSGHVKDAAHIPYEEIGQRIGEVTSDKDATIHLYCRTGRRSGMAQDTLKAMGFTHTINEGGYEDVAKRLAQL